MGLPVLNRSKATLLGFLASPDVLSPYRPERSLFRRSSSKGLFYLLCAFVGLIYGFFYSVLPTSFYFFLALPIVLLALLVIWALPDRRSQANRIISPLFFIFLCLNAMWPNYLALTLAGLPWITATRIVSAVLSVVFLVNLSTREAIRESISGALKNVRPLPVVLTILLATTIYTVPFSSNIPGTIKRLVDAHLDFTLMFVLALWVFSREANVRVFLLCIPVFVAYQVTLGVLESVYNGIFWAKWVPSFLAGDPFVYKVLAGSVRIGIGTHRSQGTFSTALSYAEFLALCLPFLMVNIISSRSIIVRAVSSILICAAVYAIYLSQSRLGFVGSLAGLATMLALIAARLHGDKLRRSLLGPAAVLFAPMIGICVFLLTLVSTRLRMMVWGAQHTVGSDQSREFQYTVGFEKIRHWPFGYGMGQAATQIGQIDANGDLNIDTYYMLVALDLGVIGFLCFYGTFLYVMGRACATSWRHPIGNFRANVLMASAACLATFITTKAVLSQEDTHSFVWIVLGLAIALIYQLRGAATVPVSGRGR